MNLFPLCTASVWPTKSGVMVLRRDQVLNTFFSFRSLRARIFTISDSSTYGPFFTLRPMLETPFPIRNAEFAMRNFAFQLSRFALLRGLPPFTSPNNEFRGALLLVPCLFALDLAPRIG